MTVTIDISTESIIRRLGVVLLLVAAALVLYHIRSALGVFVVAGFIAIAVNGPVNRLSPYMPGENRRLATTLVFILIGLIVSLIVALIVPVISTQGRELAVQLPSYLDELQMGEGTLSRWLNSVDLVGSIETLMSNVATGLAASSGTVIGLINRLLSNLLLLVFTVALAFHLTIEGPTWIDGLSRQLSKRLRSGGATLIARMYKAVTGFVNGQLIVTSISATTTLILLTILGMPAPVSLAAVIWLTGLIPLIGNTLGAVIIIAVALSQSIVTAIMLGIFYIIYQQIENNVFEPIIQSRTISMTPLFVLLSALVGVYIAGFVGALLAIPAGACLKILINYYIEKGGPEALTHR
ncbi:MAG: AI-2E family transporter [Candidatus Saccharimonadales bacterium]